MAIYVALETQFRKYIPPGETMLATIYCEPLIGTETHRCCLTEKRFAILEKKGVFSWDYGSISFDRIRTVWVNDGTIKSTIVLVFNNGSEVRFPNVNKGAARELVAAFLACLDQDNEAMSQRTKTCPECDELVKYRAKRCKHCGYGFVNL